MSQKISPKRPNLDHAERNKRHETDRFETRCDGIYVTTFRNNTKA